MPDTRGRHAHRLLSRARSRACHRRRRGRARGALVAQARRAARVPGAESAQEPHPRAPGRPAVERPRRAPGPPLTERGAPRAAARPRGRAAGGRRGSGPVGARRRGARLRPVRRAVPTERVDRRRRTGRWRVPRGPGDPGSERVRELARRRTGAVASAGARGPGAGGCGGPGPRGRGRGGSRGAPRGRARPHVRAGGPRRAARVDAGGRPRGGPARGRGGMVEGEPGEGKARLIGELVAHARLDEASVATARAVPADQRTEWSALSGLLAGGLGDAPGLAGAPPGALAGLAMLDSDLQTRFRAAAPAIPIGEALGAAVGAIAAEQPLLIALDDVQWSDRATLATLPALARDTAARPVLLLLGLSRGSPDGERLDELRARLGRDLEGAVVRLGRFDAAALRELVRWALPRYDADDAERLTRRVERDTGGLPLLAVAMLEAVVAGFTPPTEAPAWPSRQRTLVDSLPGDLPPAVIGGIRLRLRALPAPAQP